MLIIPMFDNEKEMLLESFDKNDSLYIDNDEEPYFSTLRFFLNGSPSDLWVDKFTSDYSNFFPKDDSYSIEFDGNKLIVRDHYVELESLQEYVNQLKLLFSSTNQYFKDKEDNNKSKELRFNNIVDNLEI
ncbi:hypothetical protein [Pseudescherichia sp.]|uniref:hypothetical protein n=1 Tax=Pseudescherichia sp. TaxID=2055881 RepID=UPI00289DC821|nr:hypothetical protein [Pseudescherichia sp.]